MARARTKPTPVDRTKGAEARTKRPVSAASKARTRTAQKNAVATRPSGKLGLLLDHVATDAGATAEDLVAATGWQRHSVRGALSRLRTFGFPTRLETVDDRKVYRLVSAKA